MKYLFTTTSKATYCFLIILFSTVCVQAQKNTDSPYSNYGIGLPNVQSFNGNFGMAGAGIAWRPYHFKPQIYDSLSRSNTQLNDRGPNFINSANPASFSNISLTTFEFGIASRNSSSVSGDQKRQGSHTQMSHIALAMPLSEHWGFGFGLQPYSFVGYDYSTTGTLNGESISNVFEGSGGVNEVFLGTAYEYKNRISIGVSGKYKFGTITDNRRLVFNTSNFFFNTLDQKETRVSALTYDIGLQYFKDVKNDYRVIVGFTASPVGELEADQTRLIRNYTGESENENFRDTGLFVSNQSLNLPNAATYGLGFAFEHKKHWMLNLDIKNANWGDVELEPGVKFTSGQVINLAFNRYVDLNAFGSYFKKVGYRGGLRYNSSLMEINGETISEFGIALGIALPLRKSFSTLNFGIEAGRRGKDENGLIQEDFFKFLFGVTINDKWFIQRKYD